MALIFLVIISLGLLIGAIVIGANNTSVVVLDYFWGTQSFTLAVLLALTFVLGVVLASLVWGMFSIQLKMRMSSLERKIKSFNKPPVN